MLPSLRGRSWERDRRRNVSTSSYHYPAVYPQNSPANLNPLQQLINLFIAQLLSQASKNISQFSDTNESISFLVKDLETSNEFFRGTCWFETVWSMEDGLEC